MKPNTTTTLTRHRFAQTTQAEDESLDAFINRLRYEITFCDFHCETDRQSILRDQIIKGCTLEAVRSGCFKNEWSLDELINNGRRIEAAEASTKELKSNVEIPINETIYSQVTNNKASSTEKAECRSPRNPLSDLSRRFHRCTIGPEN